MDACASLNRLVSSLPPCVDICVCFYARGNSARYEDIIGLPDLSVLLSNLTLLVHYLKFRQELFRTQCLAFFNIH